MTLIEAKKISIVWKVESIDRDPALPVTAVEIRHLRAGTAEASGVADEDISDSYWKSHSIFIQRNISEFFQLGKLDLINNFQRRMEFMRSVD